MAAPIVYAYHPWPSNAHLIEGVAALGHIARNDLTLDATHGRGIWWKRFRPDRLVTNDALKGRPMLRADFRRLPFAPGTFDVVAFDPPYKLNGRPGGDVDERFGVDVEASWQDRMQLCLDGIVGAAEVVKPGTGRLLVKCMDQVCSGRKRWQTREFADHAEAQGMRLVDKLEMITSSRPQPQDRRQVHARQNSSTLLILKKNP